MEMHWQLLTLAFFIGFFPVAAIIGHVFNLDEKWG